jgi:hypothetical protein
MSIYSTSPLLLEELKVIEGVLRRAGFSDSMMSANAPLLRAAVTHLLISFQRGVTCPADLSLELAKFQANEGASEFAERDPSLARCTTLH